MAPLVRGRFVPEIKSTGRAKSQMDVLIWVPTLSQTDLAVLDSVEVLRDYLSSFTQYRCSINVWIPAAFAETQAGLAAIGIDFQTVKPVETPERIESVLGPDDAQEIREIAATMLSVDADVVVISDAQWCPYALDFEELGSLLTTSHLLHRQCEIFVRGHEVPWSFDHPVWDEPWNGFYNLSEKRTFHSGLDFLERAYRKRIDTTTQETARSLVHNRLPHLCFTRDRLLFYEIQQRVSTRRNWERQEFLFEAGYFLNSYYLLIYGGFDHLALVVNGALGLGIPEKNVGATYSVFQTALQRNAPDIYALFTEQRLVEFVERIGALRHHAAHRGSIAPGKIYEKLEPEPTDGELDVEIASKGLDRSLQIIPAGPVRDAFRATLRYRLLLSKSKLLADGIVFLKIKGKWNYIRPMTDTEWNFERYHAFFVAVFTALNARLA